MDKISTQQLHSCITCRDIWTRFEGLPSALAKVENNIQDLLKMPDANFPPCSLYIQSGKMVRPALLILSSSLDGNITERSLELATVAESIHIASLLHDDVIDGSMMRRHRPTINSVYGNKFSILYGDHLLARSTQQLFDKYSLQILRFFIDAVTQMSLGQLRESTVLGNLSLSIEDYLEIIKNKTASLIAACCGAGATLGNADDEIVLKMCSYGIALGIAFQMTDDILDIWGNTDDTGKDCANDWEQNKVTFPLVLALSKASVSQREQIFSIWKTISSPQSYLAMVKIFEELLVREECLKLARDFSSQAINSLAGINADKVTSVLVELAQWVCERKC